MNIHEWVELLNGRQYGNEITKEEERRLKFDGFVIVFGYSDDNMEFRGVIHDEMDCYDGGMAYLNEKGLLKNECNEDSCPYFMQLTNKAFRIIAVWAEGDYSWTYSTDIPHEKFDILECEQNFEKYCQGIIFHIYELK